MALVERLPGVPLGRKCGDCDVICTHDEYLAYVRAHREQFKRLVPIDKGKKIVGTTIHGWHIEFEIAWEDTTGKALMDLVDADSRTQRHHIDLGVGAEIVSVPCVEVLYAIKMSHRFLKDSPHFYKTMSDIHDMRRLHKHDNGAIDPMYAEWYKARVKETYWYAHPKLNQSKEDFFKDDGIKYVYDHDTIHLSVAQTVWDGVPIPAYTFFKEPGSEVLCSKKLFMEQSYSIQLSSVVEEATVLALERSQIPHPNVWTPDKSFRYALMKVCTSITSGWWRDFAWENHDQALARYDKNYLNKFHADVASGLVKPFQPKEAQNAAM
jgi:hypothetical protein